jgi:hemerythrin superfamily protein
LVGDACRTVNLLPSHFALDQSHSENVVGTTAALEVVMKDDTIDALELLRAQHEEVDSLIEKIENSDDPENKQALFIEMADKLAAHATIEEKIFYPAVMDLKTRELLVESTEEHLSIKRVLADMMELDVDDEHFDAKLSVMKEQISHHAHEEEEDAMFPKVRQLMSADELAGLGNEMLAMFETLLEQSPRMQVPAETAEPAALPPA